MSFETLIMIPVVFFPKIYVVYVAQKLTVFSLAGMLSFQSATLSF